MKRILIMVICIIILSGCTNNDVKINNNNKEVDKKIEQPIILEEPNSIDKITHENKMSKILYDYAIEIYETKKYEGFDKTNGLYFISLKELKNKLNYNIDVFYDFDTKNHCDYDKTGITVDIDNLKGYTYDKYPIFTSFHCY